MALHELARATTNAHLMYASPLWWGFTNADDRDKFEVSFGRMRRKTFLPSSAPSAKEMVGQHDERLFLAVCMDQNHV